MNKLIIILFFFSKAYGQIYFPAFTPTAGGSSTYGPLISGTNVLGDSYTAVSGSWADLTASQMGISINKIASAGQGTMWCLANLYAVLPENSTVPIAALYGLNDHDASTDKATEQEHINAGARALCASQFASQVEMICSSNSNVSFSDGSSDGTGFNATWASRGQALGGTFFRNSSVTANETVTVTGITSTNIVVAFWSFSTDHPASTFKVTIDGVDKVTYDPNGKSLEVLADGLQGGIVPDALIFYGLSNTSHTVVVTYLDGGLWGALDWVGSLKSPADCLSIPIYMLDIPHLTSAGYTLVGNATSSATIDAASLSRQTDLEATFPGYPIVFVHINNFYTPNGINTQSDGVHPTSTGQGLIKDAVINSQP